MGTLIPKMAILFRPWYCAMEAQEDRDPTYFGYYAMLTHQQNMLQDTVRTSLYNQAILGNADWLKGKRVMDVGCGSGILSFFAAQAGAARVEAVEAAKAMARHAETLIEANGWSQVIRVHVGKVEGIEMEEPVDVLVSEPMGVLLLHERMIESFIVARDRHLRPLGEDGEWLPEQMMPSRGVIHLAPFCDIALFADSRAKARFWQQESFYGVNLSPLAHAAIDHYASQPIVGPFDERTLLAAPVQREIPFWSVQLADLQHFTVDLLFIAHSTSVIHGIAGWFDVHFDQENSFRLSTGPGEKATHWHQCRLLLPQPIAVNLGQTISGSLEFIVNEQRSYNLHLKLRVDQQHLEEQTYFLQDQQYWNIGGCTQGITADQLDFYGIYQ